MYCAYDGQSHHCNRIYDEKSACNSQCNEPSKQGLELNAFLPNCLMIVVITTYRNFATSRKIQPIPTFARHQYMQTCLRKGLVVHTTELSQPWADFAHLMVLDLSNCRLTEGDFVQLSQLEDLRVLNLSGSNISDQTIKHLHRLKFITAIYLQQTKLSARALIRLRIELPCCAVIS